MKILCVSEEIAKYVPFVVKLCYAIAGVVAVVGAISVYIAMNNEEQDVKKKIMMVVGACIFLVAAAPVSYTHLRAHETEFAISYAVFCLKKIRAAPVQRETARTRRPATKPRMQ